jgi:hypothetical protein
MQRPFVALAALLLAAAAQSAAFGADPGAPAEGNQLFTANDLLWMEVRADDQQLAESMDVYSSRAGIYLPLGQFARVLDLAISVFPAEQRAEGWMLSRDRTVSIDLRALRASRGGHVLTFTPDQAVVYNDDLYLRLDLVEALLPVRLRAEPSAQLLTVTPTEPLAYQQRREFLRRHAALASGEPGVAVRRVDTPYRLFTPPAFDVNVGGQMTRDGTDQSRQFNLRAAGDLAYAGFQAFLGSDEHGRINDVRVLLERKSPSGQALGPVGGVRAGIGDVFSPSAAIGVASFGGRGVSYSSAPLESVDLSTPLNLRGELRLGEEVELYVNETLRASQATPVQGRYEFLNVPLSLGLNTIRLVFYGSQGQKREEVRRINLGAGQVEAGQLVVRFAALQQDREVIQLADPPLGFRTGQPRVTALIDYGVSSRLTVSGGVSRYTPRGASGRTLALGGLQGSLGGMAVQGDFAVDDQGGHGATFGVAARPFDISILAHHSEYGGGFVDETRQLGFVLDTVLRRASDLRADASIKTGHGLTIPISMEARRFERSDGTSLWTSTLRTSAPVGSYYLSGSLAYENDSAVLDQPRRLLGAVDVSTLVARRIQLRGGLSYQLTPGAKVDSIYALADIQFSQVNGLHLGVVRNAGPEGELSLQTSHLYHAPWFDIASSASYETRARQWRVGLQIAFAFAPDPLTGRYRFSRPGLSTGGGVAVDAFVDRNGDGVRQRDEAPVRGVVVGTPSGSVTTDADGRAHAERLGDAGPTLLRIDAENADDPFLTSPVGAVEIVPRPGGVAVVNLPMRPSAEVELTTLLHGADVPNRPLSALNVELVQAGGGAPIGARSDHAGTATFEGVPPGTYAVRLQPEQAGGLGLSMAEPLQVTVPPGGGFVKGGEILVDVRKETKQ